jgi:hypothetical protein
MKIKTVKMIEADDWDALVRKTYGKPYKFQQQEGCRQRGIFRLAIPSVYTDDDRMYDSIPFVINGKKMGVKFDIWLKTSIEEVNNKLPEKYPGQNEMFWERNFYPDTLTLANDLYKRGLLGTSDFIPAGEYVINIDW